MNWQPIDTVPAAIKKEGKRILLGCANRKPTDHGVAFGKWRIDEGKTLIADYPNPYWEPYDHSCWDIEYAEDEWWEPTHWKPSPEPPSAS